MLNKQHSDNSSNIVNLRLRSTENRKVAHWIEHIQMLHYRTMDLTLDRVRTVVDRIVGDKVPFVVVSVAGTNGKGSVATMLESIFRHAGLKTGLYTSPHLVHFNERFVVNGRQITDTQLLCEFEKVEKIRNNTPLTFFEYGTAIAISHFLAEQVEVAVLEVGLGGRKDAVNVLDADIACITSIGTDHSKWLGNDREQIGAEKAGILRSEQLAVCTDVNLPRSVRNKIRQLHVRAMINEENFSCQWGRDSWSLKIEDSGNYTIIDGIPNPQIQGQCQRWNASGAVTAAFLARKHFNISDEAIRMGVKEAQLQGRLQLVQANPQVLVDVAHNVESVLQLRDYLNANTITGRQFAVISALAEKPIERMVDLVKDNFDEWHLCTIHDERGMTARSLYRRVHTVLHDATPISLHYDAPQAFEKILGLAEIDDRIVVFGSFITVGDVLRIYQKRSL